MLTRPQIAVLLGAAFQILTPMLPRLGVGEPIGSQSDAVRTLITPAGWAFSIWGPLFAGSVIFAIFQALPSQRQNPLLARMRLPAAGAFLGNASWALYTQLFGLNALSVVIIAWTLACLVVIYTAFSKAHFTAAERWCAFVPLSALTAWLTVATTVNIAASLRYHGIDAGSATPLISAAIIVVAGIIAVIALIRGRGNLPYAAVFLWALSAIYAAGGQRAAAVAIAALIAAVLVIGGTIQGWRRRSRGIAVTG